METMSTGKTCCKKDKVQKSLILNGGHANCKSMRPIYCLLNTSRTNNITVQYFYLVTVWWRGGTSFVSLL